MKGKQSPNGRWRKVRVSARRERKRLARRDRVYYAFDLDAFRSKHRPVPNPAYRAPKRRKLRGLIMLDVPKRLDCDTEADWSALARLLREIRLQSLQGTRRKVVLNFFEVEAIAPEAAVALVAEIQRCRAFCDPRVTITGTYPSSHDIAALLCDVGFFKVDRPAFRRHPVAIIDGNDRGVYGQQQAVHR